MLKMTVEPSHIPPPANGFKARSISALCGPHICCCAAKFTRTLLTCSETTSDVHARSRPSTGRPPTPTKMFSDDTNLDQNL